MPDFGPETGIPRESARFSPGFTREIPGFRFRMPSARGRFHAGRDESGASPLRNEQIGPPGAGIAAAIVAAGRKTFGSCLQSALYSRPTQRSQEDRTMTRRKAFSAAAIISIIAGTGALAQGTGSEGYFTLHNSTTGNVVVAFYTNDGTGWSENWLTTDALMPGEAATAEFQARSGTCGQTFAVGWLGADGDGVIDDPIAIDICAASNVYLDDNEIYYD